MVMQTQAALWPPGVGDYVRVRESGVLGEVVEIEGRGSQRQYTISPFGRRRKPTCPIGFTTWSPCGSPISSSCSSRRCSIKYEPIHP
jgi:hypothetical protein